MGEGGGAKTQLAPTHKKNEIQKMVKTLVAAVRTFWDCFRAVSACGMVAVSITSCEHSDMCQRTRMQHAFLCSSLVTSVPTNARAGPKTSSMS